MVVRGRKARKRLSPEQRREQILGAAHRVFATHDPSSVTFEEIAAEAGVSRALVYNYFGDKGSLLAEVYRQAFEDLDRELLDALRTDDRPEHRLRELVVRYVGFARTSTGTWQLLGHVAAVQHPAVQAVHQQRVAELAAALGAEPGVRLAMAGLLGLLEGVTRQWLAHPEATIEQFLADLDRQVWSGLSSLLGLRVDEFAR